jgi:hypothetical protein
MTDDDRYPTPMIIDVTQPSSAPPAPPEPPTGISEPPPSSPRPSSALKLWPLLRKYVIAPIPVVVLVLGAALLILFGAKNIQVGGLIGMLLGKKVTQKAIAVANSIPPERIRADGTLIHIGEADSKGITQAHVVAIEMPGLFSDPKTIKVTPPGATKPIEVAVPDGVRAQDVEHVIIVDQEIKHVTVKSTSSIRATDVDDLLAKYGK